jgi:hypothetical protein
MDYNKLTTDDLAKLHLDKPEERKLIEEHVAGLSQYQQGYFKHLLEGPEVLPFQNFEGHNISTPKRDRRILWSDLHSYNSLVWHYQQQKSDLSNNSSAPNLNLFIDREIDRANERRNELLQSFNSSSNVGDDDKYSLYISVQDQFISFLESEKAADEKSTISNDNKVEKLSKLIKPSQRAIALYCYYLQLAGDMETFDDMEGGKEKALKRIAAEYGHTSKTSWKALQGHYNKIHRALVRIDPNHIGNLETAKTMLKQYPEALAIAQREYNTAILKK